jgi:hypothetical protein
MYRGSGAQPDQCAGRVLAVPIGFEPNELPGGPPLRPPSVRANIPALPRGHLQRSADSTAASLSTARPPTPGMTESRPYSAATPPNRAHRRGGLHPSRDLRHIPDRSVDVGLAHRDRVHLPAMRAVHVERHGPGVAEAFRVGHDAGVGLLPGLVTCKFLGQVKKSDGMAGSPI